MQDEDHFNASAARLVVEGLDLQHSLEYYVIPRRVDALVALSSMLSTPRKLISGCRRLRMNPFAC
jgi:hypothetical protein